MQIQYENKFTDSYKQKRNKVKNLQYIYKTLNVVILLKRKFRNTSLKIPKIKGCEKVCTNVY